MPNRFSRAFNRRRSSGNVLQFEDEAPTTKSGEGTFRVLHRAQSDIPQTFDALALAPPNGAAPYLKADRRPRSYGDASDASQRGSGLTNISNSTAHTAPSPRHSDTSTLPSSLDEPHDAPNLLGHLPPHKPMQQPSPPRDPPQSRASFSLKTAGRAFSFGNKNNKQNADAKQQRDRAPTASSYASTAIPPKLDLGDANIGASDFGDMFGARRGSPVDEDVPPVPPLPPNALPQQYHTSAGPSAPGDLPRRPSSPSGYSWTSNASQEKLMSSPRGNSNANETPHFLSQFGADADSHLLLESLYGGGPPGFGTQQNTQASAPQPPRHVPDRTIQRPRPPPTAWNGTRNSVHPPSVTRQQSAPPGTLDEQGFSDISLTSPRAGYDPNADDEPLFDAPRPRMPFRQIGRATTMTKRTTKNKVMTPAEYEEAKKRRDLGIKDDDDGGESSSSESDTYEDEDETEKNKDIARHRRRQEAQLTVYRQQMMKVTGEQPSDLPDMNTSRPGGALQRSSNSAPSMLGSLPWEPKDNQAATVAGKSSDEDEDDEVPLGVLQAHGFPSKGARPPTRLSTASNGNQPTYPPPAGATRNESASGGGGNPNLPVFAKNLPQDPYVGANLVNGGRREAMGMNGDSPAPPGGVPAGGLVGIIAGEERARALRRGSPNTGGTYDPVAPTQLPMELQEQMMRQQMMQQQQPGGQNQMQVNNSMMQMMQMQMQWMQQMMHMQGMPVPPMPGMPGMSGMPGVPGMPGTAPTMPGQQMGLDPTMRPASSASFGRHQREASHLSRGPTPSTFGGLAPSSAPSVFGMQGPGTGYAPSVAPSERSMVGQPTRYRPVTPGGSTPPNQTSRTSTMSAMTVQPTGVQSKRSQSRLRSESTDDLRKSTLTTGSSNGDRPTIKAINKPKGGRAHYDDDDDDEAWADMARKRDARKSKWRHTKQPEAAGAFAGEQEGLEGLYYEGPQ